MPRLVFGPPVASVDTSVVRVTVVECRGVRGVVWILLVDSGKIFSVLVATSAKKI